MSTHAQLRFNTKTLLTQFKFNVMVQKIIWLFIVYACGVILLCFYLFSFFNLEKSIFAQQDNWATNVGQVLKIMLIPVFNFAFLPLALVLCNKILYSEKNQKNYRLFLYAGNSKHQTLYINLVFIGIVYVVCVLFLMLSVTLTCALYQLVHQVNALKLLVQIKFFQTALIKALWALGASFIFIALCRWFHHKAVFVITMIVVAVVAFFLNGMELLWATIEADTTWAIDSLAFKIFLFITTCLPFGGSGSSIWLDLADYSVYISTIVNLAFIVLGLAALRATNLKVLY